MGEKVDAIQLVQSSFKVLRSAVEDLTDEGMHEVWFGDWSAKDMLAHIASWDEFVALDMRRIGRGHIPCIASFKEGEVDSWNGFLMRPRRLWPLVQVRSEAQHCHEALLEALNTLPEAMFVPGHLVRNFLEIAAGHYRDHARNINEWRSRERI